MTLLALDLVESETENFTGFSIFVTPPDFKKGFFLSNKISYSSDVKSKSHIDPKADATMDIAPLPDVQMGAYAEHQP